MGKEESSPERGHCEKAEKEPRLPNDFRNRMPWRLLGETLEGNEAGPLLPRALPRGLQEEVWTGLCVPLRTPQGG